jgi:hypothetical protein
MREPEKKDDERLSAGEAEEDPRERAERERGEPSEAQRDPDPMEAAETHRRQPGDDAFSDREMVDDARS